MRDKVSTKGPASRKKAKQVLELIRESIHSTTTLGKIRDEDPGDPFKILVSTIMSARTRDPVTDKAAERLFRNYPDVQSLATASPEKIALEIKPVSFYNQKAKHIVAAAKEIQVMFRGQVPENYEELLELPGVGRKTAGCVLVYGFGKPAIPVDVHVHRISNRIGLVKTTDPEETERELLHAYDRKYWVDVNELFVSFGKEICRPIGPKCTECSVRKLCTYYKTNMRIKKN